MAVGLGNPGEEYRHTRHNVGADVVAALADRHGGRLKRSRESALACEVRVDGLLLVLAFPQTYYNESGQAVARLVRRHGIDDLHDLVVVHDELDLPTGRIRVKVGGGLAGNNGLRSIKAHLHSDDFLRVRIGIGKPVSADKGVEHVLHRPGRSERADLDVSVQVAADAVEAILTAGVDAAMTRFNA